MSATATATVTGMLLESPHLDYGFVVQLDSGAHVDLVSRRDADNVYARSARTGQWYLVTRTGSAVRSDMVRVRVTPAVDPGYADDTLEFPRSESFGGRVNRRVFGL